MNGSLRALAAGFLLVACKAQVPRIPFQEGGRWVAFVGSGARSTNDRYIKKYGATGIELVTVDPQGSGWGWEVSARYGEDTGVDKETQTFNFFWNVNGQTVRTSQSQAFASQHETELYELNVGARQTFWPDSKLQPYFGVGGSFFRINTKETLSGVLEVQPPPGSGVDPFNLPPSNPKSHLHDNSLGFYLRSGFLWRVFGDPSRKEPGLFASADLRGMLGHEFSYLELNIGLGIGR